MGEAFSMHEGDQQEIRKEFWFESLKVSEPIGTHGRT
jgi:hypothetical protein